MSTWIEYDVANSVKGISMPLTLLNNPIGLEETERIIISILKDYASIIVHCSLGTTAFITFINYLFSIHSKYFHLFNERKRELKFKVSLQTSSFEVGTVMIIIERSY